MRFYHGTSSIFIDSISITGLGGINPATDLKFLDILRFVHSKAEELLAENDAYQKIQYATRLMVHQMSGVYEGKKVHFNHQGIHISASRITSVVYLAFNIYGSELLKRIVDLLVIFQEANITIKIPDTINSIKVERFISITPIPIIIVANDVSEKHLVKEDGGDPREELQKLRILTPLMDEIEIDKLFSVYNYRLLKPIPPKYLRYFRLEILNRNPLIYKLHDLN